MANANPAARKVSLPSAAKSRAERAKGKIACSAGTPIANSTAAQSKTALCALAGF